VRSLRTKIKRTREQRLGLRGRYSADIKKPRPGNLFAKVTCIVLNDKGPGM
jgi:hypothetical protein